MAEVSSSNKQLPTYQEGMQYNNIGYYGGDDIKVDHDKTRCSVVDTEINPMIPTTTSEPSKEHQHHDGDNTITDKFISYQLVWRLYCVHIWFASVSIVCRLIYEIITDPDFGTSSLFSGLYFGLLVCVVLLLLFVWLYIGCVYLLLTGTTMTWSLGNIISFRYREHLIEQYQLRVAGQKETLLSQHHTSNDAATTAIPSHVVSSSDDDVTNNARLEELQKAHRSYRIYSGIFLLLLAIHSAYGSIQGTIQAIEAISQSFGLFKCVRLYVNIGFDVLVFWFIGIVVHNLYVDRIFVSTVTIPAPNTSSCSESIHQHKATLV